MRGQDKSATWIARQRNDASDFVTGRRPAPGRRINFKGDFERHLCADDSFWRADPFHQQFCMGDKDG